MQATLTTSGGYKLRTATQRRFVLVRVGLDGRAWVVQRSDTLRTLVDSRKRHYGDEIIDTVTREVKWS